MIPNYTCGKNSMSNYIETLTQSNSHFPNRISVYKIINDSDSYIQIGTLYNINHADKYMKMRYNTQYTHQVHIPHRKRAVLELYTIYIWSRYSHSAQQIYTLKHSHTTQFMSLQCVNLPTRTRIQFCMLKH